MAIQAFPGDIGDILLGVMLFGFSLVVTFIAVYRGAGPAVAAGTFSTGVSMIHGEAVPGDVDAIPIVGVMALRALSRPVIGGRIMTRLAVRRALVAEGSAAPTAGVVAVRALPAEVIGGLVLGVARLAISCIDCRVVKLGIFPIGSIMAGRTLATKVIGRLILGVAGYTVCCDRHLVIETNILPIGCVMAGRALATEMVGGLVLGVAGHTVRGASNLVVEVYSFPIGGVVAGGTLAIEVIGGLILGMAGDAICSAGQLVVEVNILPGDCRVAGGAVAHKMDGGFILGVAGYTGIRGAGKAPIRMATFTSQLSVLPHQGEESVFGTRASGWELYRMGIHCTRCARRVTPAQQRGQHNIILKGRFRLVLGQWLADVN